MKQLKLRFGNNWGGRRKGSGRKPGGARAGAPHRRRAPLASRFPLHVTVRLEAGLPPLRRRPEMKALLQAFRAGCERPGFRLVQYAVLSNHLHFLVESVNRPAVSAGMKGLLVRMPRALNRLWERTGRVFADRFHDRILRSPGEVKNALVYVLHNARRHGIRLPDASRPDPYSSGRWFDGWRTAQPARAAAAGRTRTALESQSGAEPWAVAEPWAIAEPWAVAEPWAIAEPPPVAAARTWLLRVGWRLRGLLGLPGPYAAAGP